MSVRDLDRLDALLERILHRARIPGVALAIVAEGDLVLAKGYGYRDLTARLPLTADTAYPIASTSKAFNATLLGMLVDEGILAWDTPVRKYLPEFRLKDPLASIAVTLRDLVTMRTGLPRHDWVWEGSSFSRGQLVERLQFLEPTAGIREKFQYSNLTVTASGHVAEIVTGETWEDLVCERLLVPLRMHGTVCGRPDTGNVTRSYHETTRRELKLTDPLATEATAPSGGAMHSTAQDMARWMLFNLQAPKGEGIELIRKQTLEEIHSPQIVIPTTSSARKRNATYALGWTVDTYKGRQRVSHGGYLHDVNCELSLFPAERLGIVSFVNFGPPMMALPINESISELLFGGAPEEVLERQLATYERQIVETRERNDSVQRAANLSASHTLSDYCGIYEDPAYGSIEIAQEDAQLVFRRGRLALRLQHWQHDAWIFAEHDLFWIHEWHPFERASQVRFESNEHGHIIAVLIQLERAVAPIRFERV
jgi:CubicO group peptidase (beta-lactamase class C family)